MRLLLALLFGLSTHASETNFKVTWDCAVEGADVTPANFPPKVELELNYTLKDLNSAPEFDATQLLGLVAGLENRPPNYDITYCLQRLRTDLETTFEATCNSIHRGLSDQRKEFCSKTAVPNLLWPLQGRISKLSRHIAKQSLPLYTIIGVRPEYKSYHYQEMMRQGVDYAIRNCQFISLIAPSRNPSTGVETILGSYHHIDYFEELHRQIPKASPECGRKILNEVLIALRNQIGKKCQEKALRQQCQRIRTANARVVHQLAQTFPQEFQGTNSTQLIRSICTADPVTAAAAVSELLTSVEYINKCVDLAPGQSRIIKDTDYKDANYRLSRPDKNTYVAELNFAFTPANRQKEMQKEVQECFDDKRSYFKMPTGKKLLLKVSSNPEIPKSPVEIMASSEFRSNSRQWRSGIDCETIIHETLHLMGLDDEYKEQKHGYVVDKFSGKVTYVDNFRKEKLSRERHEVYLARTCRAIGPENSIMKSQTMAFSKAYNFFSANDPVLLPAHFTVITSPGCMHLNRKYYTCASYSSKSEFSTQCRGRPRYCDNWKQWLGEWK